MKARPTSAPQIEATYFGPLARRAFLKRSFCFAGGCAVALPSVSIAQEQKPGPIGTPRGINPGRVVWAHDPEVLKWSGPGDGHWWEPSHTSQERVDAMLARAVCELTGQSKTAAAWSKLLRHTNKARGKGDVGYKAGERVVLKPNWVGMIYLEGHVNLETCTFIRRHDYMNTAPQLILALVRQLEEIGVRPGDITVCDTLACIVNEYYDLLHAAFSEVRYEDCAGKFGRIKAQPSSQALYWSSRPGGGKQDYVPACFAEAEYVINIANLKAHSGGGVTLCGKNHYGSLIRWPVQKDYFDLHPGCFAGETGLYRPLVDLIGHAHFGGKTLLYLLDGLLSGLHPRDPAPRRMQSPPFNGDWPCSLFVSQDPVAIDSVGLDFLAAEWTDFPRKPGVDDYLHEAALAHDPPSKTFYDPDHGAPTKRLPSLGAHEHWNNANDKQYSRNLGTGDGIELTSVKLGKA